MSEADRDLVCETCGRPGASGQWVNRLWVCSRCVLLGQLQAEQLLPVSESPLEQRSRMPLRDPRWNDPAFRADFHHLLGLIHGVMHEHNMKCRDEQSARATARMRRA